MERNLPLFIAFRLLFNARYYYPVFAVMQLDYGLTMAQFAILNAVWAVSIVLLEVPSGALADRFGRKRMVVAASVLMIVEMAVIAFIPLGNSSLVFWAWVINRILSGAAEASASGADEALAYDSIPEDEQEARWPRVLARLMTLTSIAFVVAMLVGAAVYDLELVHRVLGWCGSDLTPAKDLVIRFPIYLTLVNAVAALAVTLAMREPTCHSTRPEDRTLWSGIFEAGRWVLRSPLVSGIILAALVHDSVVRLFLTLNSEYYRLIEIPEAAYGLIGALFAALGIATPHFARRLVESSRIEVNFAIVSVATFLGLLGASLAIPVYGVGMVVFFGVGFGFLNFFVSHYLNREVDSHHRATVLSFRGLALNLGFGIISLVYAAILGLVREPDLEGQEAFARSLWWLPGLFAVLFVVLFVFYLARVRPSCRNLNT